MSELEKTLAFRNNMRRHLTQLSRLTGRIVAKEDLLSLDETEALRARSKAVAYTPSWRRTMKFAEKSTARFQRLVARWHEQNSSGAYVWTPLSNDCGVMRPLDLASIHWGFDFELIPDGILVVLAADLNDKIILDFSESQEGDRELELEVSGKDWGNAEPPPDGSP
jgi:hypothetical protein